MKMIEIKEPESLLEVRRWKEQVSREIETLGFEECCRRAAPATARIEAAIEAHRQARLAQAHKPAA